MARTVKEILLNGKSVNQVLGIINNVMANYGYTNKVFKGEDIWSKGDGIIMKMECFAYNFTDNSLILQARLRDAVTGESDLSGKFVAIVPKKKMRKIIDEISQKISSL